MIVCKRKRCDHKYKYNRELIEAQCDLCPLNCIVLICPKCNGIYYQRPQVKAKELKGQKGAEIILRLGQNPCNYCANRQNCLSINANKPFECFEWRRGHCNVENCVISDELCLCNHCTQT